MTIADVLKTNKQNLHLKNRHIQDSKLIQSHEYLCVSICQLQTTIKETIKDLLSINEI